MLLVGPARTYDPVPLCELECHHGLVPHQSVVASWNGLYYELSWIATDLTSMTSHVYHLFVFLLEFNCHQLICTLLQL